MTKKTKTTPKKTVTKKGKYTPGDWTLKAKRSSAGLGLFTESDIPKDACVIEYVGKELTEEETYSSKSRYLFEVSKKKTLDGKPAINKAGYINHACKPNCEAVIHAGRVFIMAIKNIKAGDELTYDYGKEYFDEYVKPVGCKCASCVAKREKAAEKAAQAPVAEDVPAETAAA